MKCFETADEMWLSMIKETKDVEARTSRVGGMREILGWSGRLLDPRYCFVANPWRDLPPFYPAAEFLWYLRGSDNVGDIAPYAPQYDRFANEGIVLGAYGARWSAKDRPLYYFKQLIQALQKENSRQTVLCSWYPSDIELVNWGEAKDIPCTLNLQFLLRDGRLNLITTMRSNDVWLGAPNDFFCYCHLQMLVAELIGAQLGWYQHNVGSLHLYTKNDEKATSAFNSTDFACPEMAYKTFNVSRFDEILADCLLLERHNRELKSCSTAVTCDTGSMLAQLVFMASSKWSDNADKMCIPEIRKIIERTRNVGD